MQRAVGLFAIVAAGVSEKVRGTVDALHRALQFEKIADGSLIQLDFDAVGAWEGKRGAEFLVAERWAQPEGAENPVDFAGFGQLNFGFLLDLEMLADFGGGSGLGGAGGCGGWAFVGQDSREVVFWALFSELSCRVLDSEPDQLAAAAEMAARRVVKGVEFVGAWDDFVGVKLLQPQEGGSEGRNLQFDLDFFAMQPAFHRGEVYAAWPASRVNRIVTRAVDSVARQKRSPRGINFCCRPASSIPRVPKADRTRLRRSTRNDRTSHTFNAAVPVDQRALSARAASVSAGGFLRTFLRRRDCRFAGTANYADFPQPRKGRAGADVRSSLPRRGGLYRAAPAGGLQDCRLRSDGSSRAGQKTGAPRSGAGDHAGNGHQRQRSGAQGK